MKKIIALLLLLAQGAHAGGVVNGQPVNAAVTNAAFLYKNGDDSDPFKLNLTNSDLASGTSITNVQRQFNSICFFLGCSVNQSVSYLPTWATTNRGTSSDTVFERVEAIDTAFHATTGHTHDGTTGNGPQIPISTTTGTLGYSRGGTNQTTAPAAFDNLIYANSVPNADLAQMATHTIKGNKTGSTANAADLTGTEVTALLDVFTDTLKGLVPPSSGGTTTFLRADGSFATPSGSVTITAPTFQILTSGSGTYTTPTSPGPLYLHIRMIGGGGEGGALSTVTGNTGGTTTFGTSLFTCTGGVGGTAGAAAGSGGAGGTCTATSGTVILNPGGGSGQGSSMPGASVNQPAGGSGASSPFGGQGGGAQGNGSPAGDAAKANTGSGGGGQGNSTVAGNSGGGGGGQGGYLEVVLYSPGSSYSYGIGAGGTGASANGGDGGSGIVIVSEYYQ